MVGICRGPPSSTSSLLTENLLLMYPLPFERLAPAQNIPIRPFYFIWQVELRSASHEVLAEAALYVVVEAVNNAPFIASPLHAVMLDEDGGPTHIPGVYVTDPDAHETPGNLIEVCYPACVPSFSHLSLRELQCRLNLSMMPVDAQVRLMVDPPEAGALSFRQPGASMTPSNGLDIQSAHILTLESELSRANVILEGLYFWPALDFYGTVVVNAMVNDAGATGQGNTLSANSTFALNISPANDAPEIVVPRMYRRSGGRGPLHMKGIEVGDVDEIDGEKFTALIVADEGRISVDLSPHTLVTRVVDEEDAITDGISVIGTLSEIRRALARTWFVPPSEGWEGGSVVHFSIADDQGATGTTESVVVVSDPSVEPILTSANNTFVVAQGTSAVLWGLKANDPVADAAVAAGMPPPGFSVIISVEVGGVRLHAVPSGLSPVPGTETAETASAVIISGQGLTGLFGIPRRTLAFRGTLAAVNAGLEAVAYTSANGTGGLGSQSLTIDVVRQGKSKEYSARLDLAVDVQPVNQPPHIAWDVTAPVVETPEVGGFPLSGLSIIDDDLPAGGLLSVQLQALAERDFILLRSAGAGLEILRGAVNGTAHATIAFRGTAPRVADAISACAFVLDMPGAPRTLLPALRVTVSDEDGGETSRVVEVDGRHMNSAPEVIVKSSQMVLKEGGTLRRVGEEGGVEIRDIDAEDTSYGFLEVNVSVSHRATLEEQHITTSAIVIHPVQTITTMASDSGNSSVGGTFKLSLDMTGLCSDCGVEETVSIWHDAVGNEDDVSTGLGFGSESGESVQAKLGALHSLNALGITIFCQRNAGLNSKGGREWRVTFLNAPGSLPILFADGESLTGDASSVKTAYPVNGNALSGNFALSLGGYKTEAIRFDADAEDVAAALESLPVVTAVDVATPYPTNPQGGRHWMVTFFDALGEGGDLPLMEAHEQGLGGRGAAVRVTEAVKGHGMPEVWSVMTSAAHQNLVSVVTMTGALHATGYFQLGLDLGGSRAWTRPIYPRAVGPVRDESGSWFSLGGIPGQRRGESVEARLLSLDTWDELGPEAQVVVKRNGSGNGRSVEWRLTFVGSSKNLKGVLVDSSRLKGGATVAAAVSTTHNQVTGFFSLAYGDSATPLLAHDSSGADIAAALNALRSLHSSDTGTGIIAATRRQAITLEGGRRWCVVFLRDAEGYERLTASGTTATGLAGNSARASTSLVREGGRGANLRLVDLGGERRGLLGYTTGERLTVRGRPGTVTTALASLSYTPRSGWNGNADVIIRAYDGGFSGIGGAQSGWGIVSVVVEPANNSPEVVWCGRALGWSGARVEGANEDVPFRLLYYDCDDGQGLARPAASEHIDLEGPGTGLQVRDPDGGASILQVRRICESGLQAMTQCAR